MKLVIDSSAIIDYLRGGIKWERFLLTIESSVDLYLPTIVIFELFSGKSSKKESDLVDFIKHFKRIELNENIARKAGELYRDVSFILGVSDYIIAASALEIEAAVVTLNEKHFKQIPGLQIYPL